MGTQMACNYANVFMGKFEQLMLRDNEMSFNRKPSVWLRYIDDIFLVWNGDETSLKHFIQFCNSYASNNDMKSTVKFTTNYSQTHVTFLDTKVKFNNGKLVTELHAKPSASFQYLHILPPATYFQSDHKVPIHTNSSNLHHTRRLLGSCYKIHIFFQILRLY